MELEVIRNEDSNESNGIQEHDRNLNLRKARTCIYSLFMLVFIGLSMIIGILIVCLTSKRLAIECISTFERTMRSSLVSSSQPRSVAIGDLNNDNLLDIVVANSGTNTIGIFISQGDGNFNEQQTYSTGSNSLPYSVTIAHFNNDTYLDIAVANYGLNNIGLFIGLGNGSFIDFTTISLGSSRPIFVTIGDFNNDNQTDLVVVNSGTNSFGILLADGNASFGNYEIYSTGYDSFPCSLVVNHFNNDSYLDIAIVNSYTDNIGIFLGIGNGSFQDQFVYSTGIGSNPSSISTGDFNNDNHLDLVVSNYAHGNIGIFFGYGNGTFQQQQQTYLIGLNSHPQYVNVAHLNRDKHLDIIIIDSINDQIHIYRGFGNGYFDVISTYDGISQSYPFYIALADFNNNNQTDIVLTNSGINNILILMDYFVIPSARKTILLSNQAKTVAPVVITDLNNDNILDIVTSLNNLFDILIGLDNETFIDNSQSIRNSEYLIQYISVGDVNNDNKTDIIIADIVTNTIGIYLGHGNGYFSQIETYFTGSNSAPIWLALGDFNHDNALDIVSANQYAKSIDIYLGYGNGSFAPMINYFLKNNNEPLSVAVDYIDSDHHLDFAVCDSGNMISIYIGFGNGSFYLKTMFNAKGFAGLFSIALSDLNNDDRLDIVVVNTWEFRITIFLGYGNGTFEWTTDYSTGMNSHPYYVIVNNFNNDHINDIVVSNFNSNEILIFYGYGNGSFELARNFSTGNGSSPYGIAAADLNNDKQLEIVVAFWGSGQLVMLTEYFAATFNIMKTFSTGSAPQASCVASNQSLIVTANSATDNLNIFFMSTNNSFYTDIGKNSQPKYVITCDINNDQQLDIISVNSKSNTISIILGNDNETFQQQIIYSTGDNSYPFAIVSGDLNKDTRLDLIIANEGTDEIGLFYGFNYTTFQSTINYLNDEFLRPYGIVVSDFNNDDYLDIAVTFVESHQIGILLGYGNGTFLNIKTYSTGNGSFPVYVEVGDFNRDNKTDIAIANDGTSTIGIFLGYGNGSFDNMMTYSTGENTHPINIDIKDLNNDQQLDIVVANFKGNNIGILFGYGNGSFSNVHLYSTGNDSNPCSVVIDDINNDQQLDIIVVNRKDDSIGIFIGYTNGTFQDRLRIRLPRYSIPFWVTVGDFNNDNHLDIVGTLENNNSIAILLGPINYNFPNLLYYSTGSSSRPMFVYTNDFNQDNYLDIAVVNGGTNSILIFFGLGDGTFLQGKPFSTGANFNPKSIAIGHFNNDFRLDITVANYISKTIIIFLGDDNEPFGNIRTISTGIGSHPHSVAIGDSNNDGQMDIFVANYGKDNIGIFLGYGNMVFGSMMTYSTGINSSPYCIALADLNNDENLDIVVTNSESNNILIMFGIGNGSFIEQIIYSTGQRSRPYQILIHDMNNDHLLDLIIANSGTSNILIIYGLGNQTFGNEESYSLGYQYEPYSIAINDLNNDHKMDIIVACYRTDHVEILLRTC